MLTAVNMNDKATVVQTNANALARACARTHTCMLACAHSHTGTHLTQALCAGVANAVHTQ